MKVTLGDLIKRFRIEKKMTAKEISVGLCKTSTMSEYENGVKIPDSILFCCFMERMGVTPVEFAIMVSKPEYEYLLWKEQVLAAIEAEAWDEVQTCIEQRIQEEWVCNAKLEEQFLCYVQAVYEANVMENYRKAAELMHQAIQLTVDLEALNLGKAAYSTEEIGYVILYLYYGMLGNAMIPEDGKALFYKVERYIKEKKETREEASKIYPKLICVGMNVLSEAFTKEEKLHLCESAMYILRVSHNMYDILELLRIYISLISETNEIAYYRKHLEVFEDLWKRAEMDEKFRPEVLYFRMPKVYLLEEYLYSKRKEKELTQEALSEGICEPETYSRIENGRQKPKRKKYYALADRLGIGWGYFRGDIYTDDANMYELKRLHRVAALEERYVDSLGILSEMEQGLDMTNVSNLQYIKTNQIRIKCRLNEISPEETYTKLKELLELTKKVNFDFKELVYYTQTEIETLTFMAQILRELNRSREGILLLENMLEQIERSKVSIAHQGTGAWFAKDVLSGLLFSIGEYEKSNNIENFVFKLCMKMRDSGNIPEILDTLADNLEHIGCQYSKEYMLLYRQSYYVAEFFQNVEVAIFMKTLYEEKFGKIN